MNALRDVAVVGVGQTDFGALYAERDAQRDAYALGAEAFRLALADSGLRKDEVDGLLTARIRYEHSADVLGIPNPRVLNALEGSGTRMNKIANGYRVGGKTGTAEKVVNGKYTSNLNFNAFASAFPLDNPRYAMVVVVDQPQAEAGLARNLNTAGWNAGEMTGRIVQRIAPMLGIAPDFSQMLDSELVPPELR